MRKQIAIIDYGIGNVTSVENALRLLGYETRITREVHRLRAADFLILPGVGSFDVGMKNLASLGLKDLLDELVLVSKKPILGICLGMQLMGNTSEENGFHRGLGWISGDVKRLELPESFRVPHVGWNDLAVKRDSPIFSRLTSRTDFYFDHSYHFVCHEQDHVLATTQYGCELTATISKENIWGVQFHPEKSQNNGLKLFRGIIEGTGALC